MIIMQLLNAFFEIGRFFVSLLPTFPALPELNADLERFTSTINVVYSVFNYFLPMSVIVPIIGFKLLILNYKTVLAIWHRIKDFIPFF